MRKGRQYKEKLIYLDAKDSGRFMEIKSLTLLIMMLISYFKTNLGMRRTSHSTS